jgi:hypothetical protein
VNGRVEPYTSDVTVQLATADAHVHAPGSPFPAGLGAYNLAVGDLNADGRIAVVSSSFEGDAVTVLLGTIAGTARRK